MREIVINTSPVIALIAATGSLQWLGRLYRRVFVPHEVHLELLAGGNLAPEPKTLAEASEVIAILPPCQFLPPALVHELDSGEASVIHTALTRGLTTVAIDEKAGRRVARLNGLKVTGSIGVLIRAKKAGLIESLAECLEKMRAQGIWISPQLVSEALKAVDEV